MKNKILIEISEYCRNCHLSNKCIEEECILFRIEKLLVGSYKNARSERFDKLQNRSR